MASCPFPFPTSINHRQHNNRGPPPTYNCSTATANSMTFFFPSCSNSKINLRNSFSFKRNSWRGRCHATGPQSEPPSKKHLPPSSGVTAAFARFQDTLQIFFAVLFWMSLFFWSSAWGGRDGGGRNKGSRFRK
ncbi:hypothetical protein CDL12_05250 [Handroanthus impetiginosus]|uniref:Uncharacterized protein n=1 Tax=Handroanthus impetiginosus TaxID=429701 RepID=A0A2G9HWY2_9LAMI|nr:hypothetical protein CDL12_05250 [Handroanthus impetiginosus]